MNQRTTPPSLSTTDLKNCIGPVCDAAVQGHSTLLTRGRGGVVAIVVPATSENLARHQAAQLSSAEQ